MNVPEEELREMVGASLVPATEAVKEARVLVAGEELESVTPRSKTRFPEEGLSEVFVFESVEESFACASVRAAAIFGEGESAFSSSDGSGDGVGDAAQATSEMESPSSKLRSMAPPDGAIDDEFSLDPSRISAVVTEIWTLL